MEYEYDALRGDLPDVYAFATTNKDSTLPSDAFPCNVKDLEHDWRVLDHQPMQKPPPPIAYWYNCNFATFVCSQPNIESFVWSQPEYILQYYHNFKFFPVAFSLYTNLHTKKQLQM